jgi:hypothetical protein
LPVDVDLRSDHEANNVPSGNGVELAAYLVEKGKPLIVLVN